MKPTMKNMMLIFFTLVLLQINDSVFSQERIQIQPPEDLYGKLFYDIQTNTNICKDSKCFVDAVPLFNVAEIRDKYEKLITKSDSAITDFIHINFKLSSKTPMYQSDSLSINEHITKLWNTLKRQPDEKQSGTLIPLPYPYIIPGGRFREIYYWDSYFTMLGLQKDHQIEMIQNMVDNLTYLIDSYGFIPNGNRTYYLSRSQPPFYAMMIQLLAQSKSDSVYLKFLSSIEKEYDFWMNGADKLTNGITSYRRVVKLPDGEILNRYWDDMNTPRAESYHEDINTANDAALQIPYCDKEVVYRHIRAAAESGWDFSSRWLKKDKNYKFNLYSIHTTDIIPVDLNSLVYNMELTMSKGYQKIGDTVKANEYKMKALARKKSIIKYCWSKNKKFFMDFDFKAKAQTDVYSIAGVYPLFFHIADKKQAIRVANKIQYSFLYAGGVSATLNHTGHQWDAPNGWAPLQWICINGLRNYGQNELADTIKNRWLQLNQRVYNRTFKMLEKYNVENLLRKGGGGEYPNQDGFGWTNGVYKALSKE
jgi:alpha,alpha-trehalase